MLTSAYQTEDVTLYHADALDVLPTLEGIGAVVTDPPYGLANTRSRARPSKWQRAAGMVPREWDALPAEVSGLLGVAEVVAIWGGNYFPLPPARGWLAWVKPDAPPSMASLELAWTNRDANARHIIHSIGATNRERCGHPTQKPLAVMRWCLEQLALPADCVVCDPYAGSGTTGVACLKSGHRCVLIEKDARYIPTIIRRLEDAKTPLFQGISR